MPTIRQFFLQSQMMRFLVSTLLLATLIGTACGENVVPVPATPTSIATPTVIPTPPATETPTATHTPTPVPNVTTPSPVDKLREMAHQIIESDVTSGTSNLISTEYVEWRDASLNCPKSDYYYAQVITPGYKFTFEVNEELYSIHSNTTGEVMFLCEAPSGATDSPLLPPPTATATPEATATPMITIPDPRYAVIGHTQELTTLKWFLDDLGTQWYLDGQHSPEEIVLKIPGHSRLFYVDVTVLTPIWTAQQIAMVTLDSPGAVWYISGEPNRRFSPDQIIEKLHSLYTLIKSADPSARIMSPSMLNFDFTCNGCGGYTSGRDWLEHFLQLYQEKYQKLPPIDVWALDLYPLDWVNLPTTNAELMTEQVTNLRQYLNTFEEFYQAPIWITELGLHWGWADIDWSTPECNGQPSPKGEYEQDKVLLYFEQIFDFLENNADAYSIEKWFIFITYYDISTCNYEAYNGASLYESGDIGSPLTKVGKLVKNRIYHIE